MSKLFRKEALESLSSPEQLNTLLKVTNPVAWLALGAALVLTVTAIAWGFLGSLAVTVSGPGVLLPEAGLRAVPSLTSGVLTEMLVKVDQVVKDNAVVARMRPVVVAEDGSNRVEVTSDQGGRVIACLARPGQFVDQGQNIAILAEPGVGLECVAYFAFDQGDKVAPGMTVRVLPSNAREDVFGSMEGMVVAVAPYPTTRPEMEANLADSQLVDFFLTGGHYQEAPLQVRISLKRDLNDPTTYAWTSGKGPSRPMRFGTSCEVEVITEYVRPVELIMPKIREFFDAGDATE
jgi:hypothetical protein